jgi:hypothetical protein
MARILHLSSDLLVSDTKQELVRSIHYLKPENQALRNRLPKIVRTTPGVRRQSHLN